MGVLAPYRHGAEDGALAMARDTVLVDVLAARRAPDGLIRSHGWRAPTLSAGRVQPLDRALLRDADAAGIDVVRRPTGGGWLLHLPGDLSITYVVAGPLRAGGLRGAAATIAEGIAAGLGATGRSGRVQQPGEGRSARASICFAQVDREEVADGEVKVAGVAVVLRKRAALVQTALPSADAAPERVAAFERRWDPRRALAVERLRDLDHERAFDAVAERVAGEVGAEQRTLPWEADWDARAASLVPAHRIGSQDRERDFERESR